METSMDAGQEKKADAKTAYSSCTDHNGIISTVSESFAALSGYSKQELVGNKHTFVHHPEMPEIIYKIMWEKLADKKKFIGFFKNRAKDGRYFWLLDEISVISKKENPLKVYFAYKRAAPRRGIHVISKLYSRLRHLELVEGIDVSAQYLEDFLRFRNVTYDEYIETLLGTSGLLKGGYYITRKILS